MTGPDPAEPPLLVVDGANVVGSRPDGWWRDRAGAAARLQAQLAAADLGGDVVLVLEGQARAGVPEGRVGTVRTVHAPADGDSAMVALAAEVRQAGREVAVVTADRELAARLATVGAEIRRPSWLLARLAPGDAAQSR